MAERPVKIIGTLFPRDKSSKPYPVTILGWASDPTLSVGGGPILPPDQLPEVPPPLVIWGGGGIGDYIDAGLPEPQPPVPPINPPSKPDTPHEGWNWSGQGWYYVFIPGKDQAQPKK